MGHREVDALQARVTAVERRLRIAVAGWVATVVGLVLLGVAVQHGSSSPGTQGILRAQGLEIVDKGGHSFISLGITRDDIPRIRIMSRTFANWHTIITGDVIQFLDDHGHVRFVAPR